MIDITMTATLRPEIIERTLQSFKKNLFTGIDARLIINIDPVGPGRLRDVVDVVYDHFPVGAMRVPKEPSFPKAFKWAWSTAIAPYVFHLEDDWVLKRPVYLGKLIEILDSDPEIMSVRLPQFHAGPETMKNWNKIFRWTGFYYEPPPSEGWLGFCGHPSLIKGAFVRSAAPLINDEMNPEKQFHAGNPPLNEEFAKWRYVVYGEPADPPTLPLVEDIGRDWMATHGYRKAGNKAFFTQWEEDPHG